MNNAFEGFESRRLWSLWDMLRFYATSFIRALEELSAIRMMVLTPGPQDTLSVDDWMRQHASNLVDDAKRLGMPLTVLGAQRLLDGLKEETVFSQWVKHSIEDVQSRLQDELTGVIIFTIDASNRKYLDQSLPLFGTEVENKFPSASEDISEAGKCLAVSRFTAAVFHLMRAMERGVQALSIKLGTNDPQKEWGKLLSDIGKAIEKMPPGDIRNSWSEVNSLLYHVKQAWRNEVMHPKQTYTEEEATTIFNAVKSFMRHLAALI